MDDLHDIPISCPLHRNSATVDVEIYLEAKHLTARSNLMLLLHFFRNGTRKVCGYWTFGHLLPRRAFDFLVHAVR